MKKSKKIRIGVITGVIVAAITGTLLGIFIPKLINKTKIDDLVKNQVVPSEGKGNFDTYSLNTVLADAPYSEKIESLKTFTKTSLKDESTAQTILDRFVDNYIIEFWKGYKGSEAFTERYDNWIKDINKEWDNKVKDYKSRFGSNWGFYFQLEVLDPVGGNEMDWKREQLRSKINADFDSYLFDQSYIRPLARGKDKEYITQFQEEDGSIPLETQDYLTSPELVNGVGGPGNRNRIVFAATKNESDLDKTKPSKANFQEFVFNEWVKTDMPLITSMTLWKHTDPNVAILGTDGYYQFFNKSKANAIYSGSNTVPAAARSGTQMSRKGEDPSASGGSSAVTIDANYKWQAYPQTTNYIKDDNANWNATDKYLAFAEQATTDGGLASAFQIKDASGSTGGINIPVKYTDDSATMYYIELGNQSSSVFNTSFTQYAAAATYKFNQILGMPADTNVPKTNTLSTKPFLGDGTPSGTEIMSNFLSKTTPDGYFAFPDQVKDIINDVPSAGMLTFKGLYNGAQSIADTIDVPDTPFILTRNEAGVHIIGIDRYDQLKAGLAAKPANQEGLINELENTLLWRHVLTQAGMNGENYLNDGFDFKLDDKIKNFYNANRSELIYKYIKANETTNANSENYVFSSLYTDMDAAHNISTSKLVPYLDSYIDEKEFKKNVGNDDNVKTKMIDLQTTKFSLTNLNSGDKVVANGIAGQLPYLRNTTATVNVDDANQGYVNNTLGMYNDLQCFAGYNKDKPFNNVNYKSLLDTFKAKADALWDSLGGDGTLIMKPLTYETAQYNQYLLLGQENDPSTNSWASDVELVSEGLNTWVSANSSKVKDMVNTQRLMADINAKDDPDSPKEDKKPQKRLPSDYKFADISKYALEGTYTDLNNMVTPSPTMPSDNASAKNYVSWQLQNAYNNTLLSSVSSDAIQYQGKTGDEGFYHFAPELARNKFLSTKLKDRYDGSVQDLVKEFIGLKSAFDYNESTGQFEFTKFRNYLVQQTTNNKKAAFVWIAKEKSKMIKGTDGFWENWSVVEHFKHRDIKYGQNSTTDVNGYIYQGAPKVTEYKNADGTFKATGTFSDVTNYDNVVPVTPGGAAYTGFQGIVTQSNGSSSLPDAAQKVLFGNKVYSFENTGGKIDASAVPTDQGSLYNIGSRKKLIELINNGVTTFDAVYKTASWLHNTFGAPVGDIINDTKTVDQAKEKLVGLCEKDTYIKESLFTRNVNRVLSVGPTKFNQQNSQFFGDSTKPLSDLTQVVFTQFNYNDVVKLFDTDGNNKLDDNDKGINWTVANDASQGFLGTSAEAFFSVAMNWYMNQSSNKTSAVKRAMDNNQKIYTYDRRLNDTFGKEEVENYKKSN